MRPLLVTSLLVVVLGVTLAAPSPPERNTTPDPDRGLYIYQAYCVSCHGEEGRGDGPMTGKLHRDFGVRPTDLSNANFQKLRTDEELAEAVRGGGKAVHKTPFMPAWGTTLTERQVGDLVSFLRELENGPTGPRASMVPVNDHLELGRVLYTVHCLACHGRSGKGDGPFISGMLETGHAQKEPPDLSDYEFTRTRSDADMEKAVLSGIRHAGLQGRESEWWHQVLQDREVRAIIYYLRSLPLLPEEKVRHEA